MYEAAAAILKGTNSVINEMSEHDAINKFAADAHEEWRKGWIEANGNVPRFKKNSDGSEGDINVPFNELHSDWSKENLAAGKAAAIAVTKFPNDEESAADFIHKEWMKRNPKTDYNAEQHVPYKKQLPENEKEKDRVHVQVMKKLLGIKEDITEAADTSSIEKNCIKTKNW